MYLSSDCLFNAVLCTWLVKSGPDDLSSQIFGIAAVFGLRRVLWRHRNTYSVKERLFLSSKKGINSFAFSSCPIYKSWLDKWTESGTNPRYATQTVYPLGPEPQAALDHATPLHTALEDTMKKAVKFTAESITSHLNLVRSNQIRHRILIKLPLMWKPGKTLFNKYKSPPFTSGFNIVNLQEQLVAEIV